MLRTTNYGLRTTDNGQLTTDNGQPVDEGDAPGDPNTSHKNRPAPPDPAAGRDVGHAAGLHLYLALADVLAVRHRADADPGDGQDPARPDPHPRQPGQLPAAVLAGQGLLALVAQQPAG